MRLKVRHFAMCVIGGAIAVAGTAVKWARDQLGIIKSADEIGQLATKVEGPSFHRESLTLGTAGVVFITAFSGLWAPYWRSDVQGTICTFSQNLD
jgi:glycerol kinase